MQARERTRGEERDRTAENAAVVKPPAATRRAHLATRVGSGMGRCSRTSSSRACRRTPTMGSATSRACSPRRITRPRRAGRVRSVVSATRNPQEREFIRRRWGAQVGHREPLPGQAPAAAGPDPALPPGARAAHLLRRRAEQAELRRPDNFTRITEAGQFLTGEHRKNPCRQGPSGVVSKKFFWGRVGKKVLDWNLELLFFLGCSINMRQPPIEYNTHGMSR